MIVLSIRNCTSLKYTFFHNCPSIFEFDRIITLPSLIKIRRYDILIKKKSSIRFVEIIIDRNYDKIKFVIKINVKIGDYNEMKLK